MERVVPSDVAFHEVGHAAVAENLGGLVLKQSVIPEGRALGFIIASFEHFPLLEKVSRMMVCLAAGFVAEERIGKGDHEGCGSDLARLDFLSIFASRFLYEGRVSGECLRSGAFSKARKLMPSFSTLYYRATILDQKGTI